MSAFAVHASQYELGHFAIVKFSPILRNIPFYTSVNCWTKQILWTKNYILQFNEKQVIKFSSKEMEFYR